MCLSLPYWYFFFAAKYECINDIIFFFFKFLAYSVPYCNISIKRSNFHSFHYSYAFTTISSFLLYIWNIVVCGESWTTQIFVRVLKWIKKNIIISNSTVWMFDWVQKPSKKKVFSLALPLPLIHLIQATISLFFIFIHMIKWMGELKMWWSVLHEHFNILQNVASQITDKTQFPDVTSNNFTLMVNELCLHAIFSVSQSIRIGLKQQQPKIYHTIV